MSEIKPIRTEPDYRAAMSEFDSLMSAARGTPEGDRLDVLVTLVVAYEAKHYPIEAPDPVELIKFVMEQRGMARADLEPMIGGKGRVSEVLNRRRPLTLDMIRRLNKGLGIPAELLVKEYALADARMSA